MNELSEDETIKALNKIIDLSHANLFSNDKKALNYLANRGISDSTISYFKLGYLPKDVGTLIRFVGKDSLFKLGILTADKITKKIICRFKDHSLIIPIYDVYGNPIAIMGRTLIPDAKREKLGLIKYINTYYKKSQSLFGLNHNKKFIIKHDKAYVVEGNFDVIMAYQNGMKNVVATCGTFLSQTQHILLARYCSNIHLMFDNDEAGQEASETVFNKYKDKDVNIFKSSLPSEVKDLDEYFKMHSKLKIIN